jgi:hypothetical protein
LPEFGLSHGLRANPVVFGLLLQQTLDPLCIIQGIVQVEFHIGDHPQLITDPQSQFLAQAWFGLPYLFDHGFLSLGIADKSAVTRTRVMLTKAGRVNS